MKTVGIVIFEGVASKNILRTGIVPALLARSDVRLAFITKSEERAAYHRKEFTDPRMTFTAVEPHRPKGADAFFARLKFFMLRTETTSMRRRALAGSGSSVSFPLASFPNIVLSMRPMQRFVRLLDRMLVRHACYGAAFEKYQPDLLVAANIFEEGEIQFLREARQRRIPTIGFINSWDKTTARSGLRILPDHFIVFNHQVAYELIRYHGVEASRIFVGGIPQYDQYMAINPSPREKFCKKIGLDPSAKIIVYSPLGGTFWKADWEMIDLLYRLAREGRFGGNAVIFVRFPPNEFVDRREIDRRTHLRYDYPGVRFSVTRGSDWDMTAGELLHLTDTLHHMSLLLCYASSISVDAAVLDRPVININFALNDQARFGGFAVAQLYALTHYRAAIAPGGIRLVKNTDELVQEVLEYLEHPGRDREARLRLAREQCAYMDGRSGERISNFILECL